MSTRWHLVVLLGLAAALLFAGLGTVALTDRDEGANAETAREMLERRSWITPTLNYAPRFAKPALVYWLMAVAYAGLGVSETAARLPSAVASAALVLLQYAFARWALGGAAAFRAALILLLAVEFVALARLALTDAVLVLWTTAAGFAFFRAHHGPPPRGRWYAAMYVVMGLGALAKGPVGILVPAVAIAAYLALAGGWGRVWREGHPLRGLALLLLVARPWYAAMLWEHGGGYVARARGETLGRVFRTVTGPGATALFYVPVLLVGFFPWSALLPGALVGTLRGARARRRQSRRRRDRVRRGLGRGGARPVLAPPEPPPTLRGAALPGSRPPPRGGVAGRRAGGGARSPRGARHPDRRGVDGRRGDGAGDRPPARAGLPRGAGGSAPIRRRGGRRPRARRQRHRRAARRDAALPGARGRDHGPHRGGAPRRAPGVQRGVRRAGRGARAADPARPPAVRRPRRAWAVPPEPRLLCAPAGDVRRTARPRPARRDRNGARPPLPRGAARRDQLPPALAGLLELDGRGGYVLLASPPEDAPCR